MKVMVMVKVNMNVQVKPTCNAEGESTLNM